MKIFGFSVSVTRRYRAARLHAEIYLPHYINFGIASPTHHRWWAFTVYIYMPRNMSRPTLCRMWRVL